MSNPIKPLHIVGLKIENIKRLSAVEIAPMSGAVIIGGNNANGKSSVLDSIEMAFTGAKGCPKPVHDGAESGYIVADLGEIVVTRRFTAGGGSSLVVSGADGKKMSSPQGILDELYGSIAFDPIAFSRMKPKDQLEELRAIVGVNTTLIDSSRQSKYDERTAVNRKVAELKAAVAAMPFHEDTPRAAISAAAISAEISKGNAANTAREEYIRLGKSTAAAVASADENIARLKGEIASLEKGRETAAASLESLRAKSDEFPQVDVSALAAKLDSIAEINARVADNAALVAAEESLAATEGASLALTAAITDLDERKRKKLEEAKYPVAGLRLTDAGVQYNGIPFEQSSSAEQLRVSVAIGIAANPRLRVMLVRDGSLLDDESLAALEKMAEDSGAQVWIERVGKGDECSIIIEDGCVEY